MRPLTCEELRELAPELALDVLSGDERGAAIAHLETCPGCHAEVSGLADVADSLLLAAPRIDPPPGFELRVLTRLESERAHHRGCAAERGEPAVTTPGRGGRLRRAGHAWGARLGLAAAALLMVVVARPTGDLSVAAAADVRAATGETIGRAVIDGGHPAEITIDMRGWATTDPPYVMPVGASYALRVDRADGSTSTHDLTHATGATWQATLDGIAAGDIVSVAVLDDLQRVWCSAEFDG